MRYQLQLRIMFSILGIIAATTLVGCAGPATKEIAVNKNELKQEQQAHRDLAKKLNRTKLLSANIKSFLYTMHG